MSKEIILTETPLHIQSPPGCGKTAMLQAMFHKMFGNAKLPDKLPKSIVETFEHHRETVDRILKCGYYTLICSQEDPIDMCGVVVASHGASLRMVPLYWLLACYVPLGLFFDELTTGAGEQINAALRAMDDNRELCGWRLHDKTRVVAASNPPEMAAGAARELQAPVLSRCRHRFIGAEYATEWMREQQHQFVRLVGVYFRNNPGAALATPEEIQAAVTMQRPFPNPRAWTRSALEIMERDMTLAAEYVGEPAAAAFLNWFNKMDLPSPVEIIAGREKTVPKRGDAVMATAAALVSLLGEKPTHEGLTFAMDWFMYAADAGQVANCIIDLLAITKAVGITTISRFGKQLEPYGIIKKMAGQLPS